MSGNLSDMRIGVGAIVVFALVAGYIFGSDLARTYNRADAAALAE